MDFPIFSKTKYMAYQSKSKRQAQGASLQGDTGAPPPNATTSNLPAKVYSGSRIGKPPPYAPILVGSAQMGYFSSPYGDRTGAYSMNPKNPYQMQSGGQTVYGGVGSDAKIKRPPKARPNAGGAVILQGSSTKVKRAAASKQSATSIGGGGDGGSQVSSFHPSRKISKIYKMKKKYRHRLPSKTLAARKNKRPYIPVSLM